MSQRPGTSLSRRHRFAIHGAKSVPANISLGGICAVFGMVLALLFAGVSSVNALDQLRQSSGFSQDQEHRLFSDLTAQLFQPGDQDSARDEDDGTGMVPQEHHHHHGDTDSAIAEVPGDRFLIASLRAHVFDATGAQEKPRRSVTGLERPPRNRALLP